MRFSILVFNSNQGSMAVGLPLKICEIFFLRIELENCHFAHSCNFRPLADERTSVFGLSVVYNVYINRKSQSIHRLKVGLYLVGTVDYNFDADGYIRVHFHSFSL